jgi:hypothetical protein
MVHRLEVVPEESSLAFLKAAQKGRIAAQQPQVLTRLGEKTAISQASRTHMETGRQTGLAR